MWRLLLVALPVLEVVAWAQSAHPITGRPFYKVTAGGAERKAIPERGLEETAGTVLDLIGIKAGATVADVEAGGAEFTWRLAERVGGTGKVFTVNTQQAILDHMRKTIAAHGFSNVKITRASERDPKLPVAELEVVLLAGAYHGLTHPQEMLRKIRESLKPEGKLVIIEYRKEDKSLAISAEQCMSIQEIRTEIEPEGYKFDKVMGMLPQAHVVIFTKAGPN
jgi:predicted methyltransferase